MKIVIGALFLVSTVLSVGFAEAWSVNSSVSSLPNINLGISNPFPGALAAPQPIVPIGTPYFCSTFAKKWRCQDVEYGSTGYKFLIRYNLSTTTPAQHVVFSLGSYFSSYTPEAQDVQMLQDKMEVQNVRSYEIEVTHFDIFNPIATAPNTSAIMAALLDYISTQYAASNKVKLITFDYSATLASYALAYHKMENTVDQVFFLGGPAGFNYMRELYDSTAPSYISAADRSTKINSYNIIDVIEFLNDWKSPPACNDIGDCSDQVILDSASMFSEYIDTNTGTVYSDVPFNQVDLKYPGVKVHNIIGANDLSWFINSSQFWYDRITPQSKTRDVMVGVNHDIFTSADVIKKILGYLSLIDVSIVTSSAILTDKTAPTAATSISLNQPVSVPATSPPKVEIVPNGATDAVGISHYEVYRDGSYVGMATPGNTFTDKTVTSGTTYTYSLITVDLAGNKSPLSAPNTITTTGVLPTTPVVGGPPPPSIVINENPSIVSVGVYKMEQGTAFDIYNYSDLDCIDNQDGGIKGKLVVNHTIPAFQTVGDTYTISISCTDSDGNKTGPLTATVQIVPVGSIIAGPPSGGPVGGPVTITGTTSIGFSNATSGLAVAGGLVPCGDAGEPSCQFCHAVSLIDNVVGWLAKTLTLLATIIFIYSGARMVTSVGDAKVKEVAKKRVIDTAIGLVIVLAAWIIIDFILQSLIGSSFSAFAPWMTIKCP